METIDIPILETERLRLRPFRRSDFDDYAALKADPEVARYLSGEVWDRARSWRHLAFLVGHWQLGGVGVWAVEHKETGAFIGTIGFAEPEGWPGFELAWTLARHWWGHGYATEGARTALAYAFDVLKKDHVISLIFPDNHRSIRVAERLGETLQGRVDLFGKEMLCYGIDRARYATRWPVIASAPRGPVSGMTVRALGSGRAGGCQRKASAPRFHAASKAVRNGLREMYGLFLAAFRDAAEQLKAGDRSARFPMGSFPPGLLFVRALPP